MIAYLLFAVPLSDRVGQLPSPEFTLIFKIFALYFQEFNRVSRNYQHDNPLTDFCSLIKRPSQKNKNKITYIAIL